MLFLFKIVFVVKIIVIIKLLQKKGIIITISVTFHSSPASPGELLSSAGESGSPIDPVKQQKQQIYSMLGKYGVKSTQFDTICRVAEFTFRKIDTRTPSDYEFMNYGNECDTKPFTFQCFFHNALGERADPKKTTMCRLYIKVSKGEKSENGSIESKACLITILRDGTFSTDQMGVVKRRLMAPSTVTRRELLDKKLIEHAQLYETVRIDKEDLEKHGVKDIKKRDLIDGALYARYIGNKNLERTVLYYDFSKNGAAEKSEAGADRKENSNDNTPSANAGAVVVHT